MLVFQQFPGVLSVFVQIIRLSVYLHLLSVRTYLPRIYVDSVSLDVIFKSMMASSMECTMILLHVCFSLQWNVLSACFLLLWNSVLEKTR